MTAVKAPSVSSSGVFSSRPTAAPGNIGAFYHASDRGVLYLSNGSSWTEVTSVLAPAFGWHNVRTYGAKVDTSTDDTTAIQAAYTAADNGHTIYHPEGTSLIPSGGLTTAKGVNIVGAGPVSQDETWGSTLMMTANTGALISATHPGTSLIDLELMHPSSGTRSAGLVGVSMTNSNFNHITRCMFSGFYDNVKIASGIYGEIVDSHFRDFIHRGVDLQYSSASPDAGDWLISNCTFDRTAADISNGVTGGDAMYIQNHGGARLFGNKVNGPAGASGFDYGVHFDVAALKTSTIVNVVGGSIEGCKTAAVAIAGDATGGVNTVIVSAVEISGLNASGSAGVLCSGPLVHGLFVSTHMKDIDTCVDLQNVKHGSVFVNGYNINVAGLRLRTLNRNIHLDPTSTFDGAVGVKAVVFDFAGLQNRTADEYTMWMPFDSISDASAHDMFEIGVSAFCPVFVEVDILGVSQGVGAFAHRLRRVVTGGNSADSTVSAALPDEYTGTGALTSTFFVTGLTGPMRYQITKASGTSMAGQMRVRVFGHGLTYFKQLQRDD